MTRILQTTLFLPLAVILVCGLAASVRSGEPSRGNQPLVATHLITGATEYYLTGPQQGRPPEGKLKAGTPVQLIRPSGSYSQVRTDSGLVAFVASSSLAKIASKEPITPEARIIAASINGFAFDLYAEIAKEEGNLFVSPASISTALAMTYAGAQGQTEKEMARMALT